jgi:hypothetical protein
VDTEAEAAAQALVKFANEAANATELWANSGCRGPRPVADAAKHAELEKAHFHAHAAAKHAVGAKGSLDRREEAVVEDLFQLHRQIEDAAAVVMAGEFKSPTRASRSTMTS